MQITTILCHQMSQRATKGVCGGGGKLEKASRYFLNDHNYILLLNVWLFAF